MRLLPTRAPRLVLGALLLLACSSDRLTAPDVPVAGGGIRASHEAGTGLVITEVMADPSTAAIDDLLGEWFEVYNPGSADVALNGWVIRSGPTGSETHTIPATGTPVVVRAGGFAVLVRTTQALGTTPALPAGTTVYVYGNAIQLNNSNTDWLTLRTPGGELIDSVAYQPRTNGTPATGNPPTGATRALLDNALDNTIMMGASWATTPAGTLFGTGDRGTPGSGPYRQVVVTPVGPVVTVTVTPSPTTVLVGATRALAAAGVDTAGRASATTFTWSSSDDAIATVSAAGVVTGVAEGVATITARAANGVEGTATVTVTVPGGVATLTAFVSGGSSIPVGSSGALGVSARTAEGTTITPAPAVTWTSSDPTVATIADGFVGGVKAGTATLTARAANGVTGTVTVTVFDDASAISYRNLEFGVPVDGNQNDEILLSKRQFALSYNAARGGPNWVSWSIAAENFGESGRCDCFTADLSLPAGVYRVTDGDYRNALDGLLDRGHMVQSDSRSSSRTDNATTFLMTNILPQASENNQGPWQRLEQHMNDLAEQQGMVAYVVAGGEYPANPTYLRSFEGATRVALPTWTWKVAVIMPAGRRLADVRTRDDLTHVIAVRMPNDTTPGVPASARGIRLHDWQRYEVTIDEIEQRTGYDFFALLPDDVERIAESNNSPPVAHIAAIAPTTEGTAITLDARGSTDPDGDALTYAWSFGDGITATGAAPVHTYGDDGLYTATVTVRDALGVESTASVTVTVANAAPTASFLAPATATEGDAFTLRLTSLADASLVDQATLQVAFDCGDGMGFSTPGTLASVVCPTTDDGARTVRARVTDKDGGATTYASTVAVGNAAPVITAFAAPSAATSVGAPVTVTVDFTDAGAADTHVATIAWGDGSTSTATIADGRATATHTYATAGLFPISAIVRDDDGAQDVASRAAPLPVYDVAAGFFIAGGWFEGAMGTKVHVTASARHEADGTPGGRLALRAGSLDLESTSIEWLVVTPGRAMLRGTARVAGRAEPVQFLATFLDDDTAPRSDRVRVQAWDATGVVFDNLAGTAPYALAGSRLQGSIDVKAAE